MRYFILFFIVIELVYASTGFCFTLPIEMTKLKNEDDDFAFYLQCVDEMKGEVWTVLTVFPKKPGKWKEPKAWINVFSEKEFIVKATINELAEGDFESQLGKIPEGASRYFVRINPKYLEHSYLSYTVGYSKNIEEKMENGGLSIRPVIVTREYKLNFKDFINTEKRDDLQ